MTHLKGLTRNQFISQALLLKLALAAIMFALATLVPVAQGPLASQAKAHHWPSSCGREGQKPCPLLGPNRHLPSCKPGLVERPFGKRCSEAKTILPKPEQVAGCGAGGEKPCAAWRAFPSCEGRLAHDILKGVCRTEDSALIRMASSAFRELKPLITTIGLGATQCGVDTIMLGANRRSKQDTAELLMALPCFDGLLDQAQANGYRTLTIGGSGGASIGIGAEGENGFAFDTSGNRQVRTYHTLSLKFLSIGASAAVNVGLYKAPPSRLAGDAHGASVGVAYLGGGGAAVWYNYGSDDVAGLTAVITAGGKAEAAYVRNTTKTVDVFNVTKRVPSPEVSPGPVTPPPTIVRPPAPPPPPPTRPKPEFGWSGRPVDGNYRAPKDAAALTRYFITEGRQNQKLFYRYKNGNGDWSKWRGFNLTESGRNYHHYVENNGSGQSFTIWNNGQEIVWKQNQNRNARSFTMRLEAYLGRYD